MSLLASTILAEGTNLYRCRLGEQERLNYIKINGPVQPPDGLAPRLLNRPRLKKEGQLRGMKTRSRGQG
jgi:hypothetical protein